MRGIKHTYFNLCHSYATLVFAIQWNVADEVPCPCRGLPEDIKHFKQVLEEVKGR